jgi:hypothetical protein
MDNRAIDSAGQFANTILAGAARSCGVLATANEIESSVHRTQIVIVERAKCVSRVRSAPPEISACNGCDFENLSIAGVA